MLTQLDPRGLNRHNMSLNVSLKNPNRTPVGWDSCMCAWMCVLLLLGGKHGDSNFSDFLLLDVNDLFTLKKNKTAKIRWIHCGFSELIEHLTSLRSTFDNSNMCVCVCACPCLICFPQVIVWLAIKVPVCPLCHRLRQYQLRSTKLCCLCVRLLRTAENATGTMELRPKLGLLNTAQL